MKIKITIAEVVFTSVFVGYSSPGLFRENLLKILAEPGAGLEKTIVSGILANLLPRGFPSPPDLTLQKPAFLQGLSGILFFL